jgi:hypothetical protein
MGSAAGPAGDLAALGTTQQGKSTIFVRHLLLSDEWSKCSTSKTRANERQRAQAVSVSSTSNFLKRT